jgi:hypothetical protein
VLLEETGLLGYDTISIGKFLPTFETACCLHLQGQTILPGFITCSNIAQNNERTGEDILYMLRNPPWTLLQHIADHMYQEGAIIGTVPVSCLMGTGAWGLFPWRSSGQSVQFTSQFLLVPKEKTGASPPLSYTYVITSKCLMKHFTFQAVKLIYSLITCNS